MSGSTDLNPCTEATTGILAVDPAENRTSLGSITGLGTFTVGGAILEKISFDNVHLTRDNPNVPSDLEQMPNLYNFLKGDGVVLANTHDVLVHTATNFISNQTGLYPDRTGITQSNSFSYYDSSGATHTGVSFAYWTDPLYDPTGERIRA